MMGQICHMVKAFVQDEEGASAVEYALLVAGIAVAIVTAVYALGTQINTMFGNIKAKLT
jgi:pilus assembly protein Flp/PilA